MAEFKDKDSSCADLTQRHDHDRYLTALYAPEDTRQGLFALYAFNYEISKIRQTVSEPMLGEIRLQWWREAIDGIFQGAPRSHEVIQPLAQTIERHDLPPENFLAMIDGRTQDIYDESPADMAALDNYLSLTGGKLTCLAVHIAGQKDIDDLALEMGKAWGYIGLIRAIPYHLSLKKNFIPAELMDQHGLGKSRFLSPDEPAKNAPVIMELCRQAEQHLDFIHRNKGRIKGASRSVFLLSALARSYLKTIKKADYDPFRLEEKADAGFRQGRLLLSALFNRV